MSVEELKELKKQLTEL
jgi:hypothetical protein